LKFEKLIQPNNFPVIRTIPVTRGKIIIDIMYHFKFPFNFGLNPISYQPSPANSLNNKVVINGKTSQIPILKDSPLD
jgi:hypothetical protein